MGPLVFFEEGRDWILDVKTKVCISTILMPGSRRFGVHIILRTQSSNGCKLNLLRDTGVGIFNTFFPCVRSHLQNQPADCPFDTMFQH